MNKCANKCLSSHFAWFYKAWHLGSREKNVLFIPWEPQFAQLMSPLRRGSEGSNLILVKVAQRWTMIDRLPCSIGNTWLRVRWGVAVTQRAPCFLSTLIVYKARITATSVERACFLLKTLWHRPGLDYLTNSSAHGFSLTESICPQLLHALPTDMIAGSWVVWVTCQRMISSQMLKQLTLCTTIGGMSEYTCCNGGLWLTARSSYFMHHMSGRRQRECLPEISVTLTSGLVLFLAAQIVTRCFQNQVKVSEGRMV